MSRLPRALLVVNPNASAVDEKSTAAVERELADVHRLVTRYTERRGHAADLVRELAPEFDRIFVFSGDGGFNEALNGLDADVEIGFVPGGGTSVLPRALGVSRAPAAAARALARSGATRRISLGRVDGRRFAFSAGIGLDAAAVRAVDALGRARGRRPGDIAFVAAFWRLLRDSGWRLEPALEVEGAGRAACLFVANTDPYTYAGPLALRLAPDARFELGLDVVAPVRVTPQSLPRLLLYAVRGRGQREAADVLHSHDLDGFVVRCDRPLPLQVDGEDLGDVTEARFEAERAAVTVIVPE